ncbi:MAG: hypothetical protein AAFP84_21395, partial [Actinomycetota bacterium]
MSQRVIEQVTARIAVLPARVVYLIGASSREGFRRSIQEASSRWAGMTEMIVPLRTRGGLDPAWAQMIEHGSYDCLVNVDAPDAAAARAAVDLRLPLVPLEHIDRRSPSEWSTHPACVGVVGTTAAGTPVMAATVESPLWELAAAGHLPEEHLAENDDHSFVRAARTSDEIGRAELAANTLLDRGLEQFGEHRATGAWSPAPTILWVTKPNSLRDCIWFWNCRALRPLTFDRLPIHLVPDVEHEDWVDFDRQVRSALARAVDIEPDVVVCSLSVGERRLKAVARSLGLRASTKKRRAATRFPPAPVRTPPFTYRLNIDPRDHVLFHRQLGRTADTIIQVGTPKTILRVDSPVQFSGGGRLLVRIASSAFDHLPKTATTAAMVLKNADWSDEY